mmetsp:Transcript_32368/g.85047  ORF Transcript_32368/g.85047 Transcript_32368/m.85047 type:complete len:80 (-) Transcript_32368:491-730(-)
MARVGVETTHGLVKSLLVNLLMAYAISLPVLLCLVKGEIIPQVTNELMIAFGALVAITYVAPPLGWKRPHETSDQKSNR